jgi:hypothetical protein
MDVLWQHMSSFVLEHFCRDLPLHVLKVCKRLAIVANSVAKHKHSMTTHGTSLERPCRTFHYLPRIRPLPNICGLLL